MTDEQPPSDSEAPEPQAPEPQTRRARLATRRQRLRFLGSVVALAVLIAGLSTAVALRDYDSVAAPIAKNQTARKVGPVTEPNLGRAKGIQPPRALTHADPLRLWIGGDSLAGSFGPALGQTAGATGVVDATIDYKVSSGLADQGIRDWYEHAQEKMASDDPDAVVFIIGTNDASIANTYDSNDDGVPDWEVNYREKIDRMLTTFVGGARHRTVFWLGPPTLGDDNLDRGASMLGPVMREEVNKFAPDVVYVDTYRLFEGEDGGYSRYLPDAKGESVQVRISDGVHFTVDGAQYLANILYKLLDKRWDISGQAQPGEPIEYTIAHGSNDYVPGVGRYRPSNGSSSNSGSDSGSDSGSSSGSDSGSSSGSGSATTTVPSAASSTIANTPTSATPSTTPPTSVTPTTKPTTTVAPTTKPPTTAPHPTTPPTT